MRKGFPRVQLNLWGLGIALLAGAIAGAGILRSRSWVLALAIGLGIAQIIGWMLLSLVTSGEAREDWDTTLWASFLLALMTVVPYMTIGAVLVSGTIAWTRHLTQKRAGN